MPESLQRRQVHTRLLRVDLPRMQVENHRPALLITLTHEGPRHRIGKQAKVAAARAGYLVAIDFRTTQRKLKDPLRQLMGMQGSVRNPVIRMKPYGKDGRVVVDTVRAQNIYGPPGFACHGKGWGAKTTHRSATALGQHFERPSQIRPEFFRLE